MLTDAVLVVTAREAVQLLVLYDRCYRSTWNHYHDAAHY